MTPSLLGFGQRWSSAWEVGLIRLSGITLPANGTGTAVLCGQAPSALNAPAQGSRIGVAIKEKSPARSSAVGTVAVYGCPMRRRKLSQLPNQNVRLRPL